MTAQRIYSATKSETAQMEREPVRPASSTKDRIRFVYVCLAFGCLVVAAIASLEIPSHPRTITYIVRPGDSPWTIALHDKAFAVAQEEQWIEARYGDDLQAGQTIRIPVK